MVKKKTGKVVNYDLNLTKGTWFDPLIMNQTFEGVFTKTFQSKSDYMNQREGSPNFGKKAKTNYEFKMDKGGSVSFNETGGPLQALFDDLKPGDWMHLEFKHLALPDGTPMPKTIKDFKQLEKWCGKGRARKGWPVWGKCWVEKRG